MITLTCEPPLKIKYLGWPNKVRILKASWCKPYPSWLPLGSIFKLFSVRFDFDQSNLCLWHDFVSHEIETRQCLLNLICYPYKHPQVTYSYFKFDKLVFQYFDITSWLVSHKIETMLFALILMKVTWPVARLRVPWNWNKAIFIKSLFLSL